MNLTSIYKGTKLYKVSSHAQSSVENDIQKPTDFSGLAVLYEYEELELPTGLSSFLTKVIEGGMKLDPATVLTANLSQSDVTIQKLAEQAGAKTVIIFGTDWLSTRHNARLEKNRIIKLFGMKVLATDTLDVINTDDAAKKAFWVELKKVLA